MQFFFFFGLSQLYSSAPVRVECEDSAVAWLAGALVAPSVQGHGLPLPRSYGPIRVFFFFFGTSCSWQSEGFFGQLFSVALPFQALEGLPCLGFFSVVRRIRQIEGAPLGWGLTLRIGTSVT